MDWPADPGCGSAAGDAESGDGESCQSPEEVTSSTVVLDFSGAARDETLVCDGRTDADRVLGFRMPGTGTVRISASPEVSALAIRDACAEEREDLACNSSLSGDSSLAVQTSLPPGPHAILVKGTGTATLQLSGTLQAGAACDPEAPWFECPYLQSCVTGPSGAFCVTSACTNGVDDDGDGLVDYPADPGCASRADNNEVDPAVTPACRNGLDDDEDGLTDWPSEPGCVFRDDEDEADPSVAPQCSNGVDDDGDGLVDYGSDAECASAGSNDEGLLDGTRSVHLPSEPQSYQGNFPPGPEGLLASSCVPQPSTGRVFHWVAPYTSEFIFISGILSLRTPSSQGSHEVACWTTSTSGPTPRLALRQGDEVIITTRRNTWESSYWLYIIRVGGSVTFPLAPPPELPWPEAFTGDTSQPLTPWSQHEGATPWLGEF
jgi:hypothetical protein